MRCLSPTKTGFSHHSMAATNNWSKWWHLEVCMNCVHLKILTVSVCCAFQCCWRYVQPTFLSNRLQQCLDPHELKRWRTVYCEKRRRSVNVYILPALWTTDYNNFSCICYLADTELTGQNFFVHSFRSYNSSVSLGAPIIIKILIEHWCFSAS